MRTSLFGTISVVILFIVVSMTPMFGLNETTTPFYAPGGDGGEGGEGESVTLTRPVGGEEYNVGDVVNILFHNSGLTEIYLRF